MHSIPKFNSFTMPSIPNFDSFMKFVHTNVQKLPPQLRTREVGLGVLGLVAAVALWSIGKRVVSWISQPRNTTAKVQFCFNADELQAIAATKDSKTLFSILNRATKRVFKQEDTFTQMAPIFGRFPLMLKNRVNAPFTPIHANEIQRDGAVTGRSTKRFVASVAPCMNNIQGSVTLAGFLGLALFHKVGLIVSIQSPDDGAPDYLTQEAGQSFYPGLQSDSDYPYIVKVLEQNQSQHDMTKFQVTVASNNILFTKLTYKDWKYDEKYDVPKLQAIVEKIATCKEAILVHGLAGVGRTVTVIVASFLRDEIKSRRITKDNLNLALLEIIMDVRSQRGPESVENQVQFDLLLEYGNRLLDNK